MSDINLKNSLRCYSTASSFTYHYRCTLKMPLPSSRVSFSLHATPIEGVQHRLWLDMYCILSIFRAVIQATIFKREWTADTRCFLGWGILFHPCRSHIMLPHWSRSSNDFPSPQMQGLSKHGAHVVLLNNTWTKLTKMHSWVMGITLFTQMCTYALAQTFITRC